MTGDQFMLHIVAWSVAGDYDLGIQGRNEYSALSLSILKQKLEFTIASCIISVTMVAPGIYHVKACLVDLIGSSGIENAMSAQPKNLHPESQTLPPSVFWGSGWPG